MSLLGAYAPNFGVINTVALQSAQDILLGPEAGLYQVVLDKYHTIQYKDTVMNTWRGMGTGDSTGAIHTVWSDGVNVRIANNTGCAVGALLTNAGTGYTSAPSVAASAGGSLWRAIVGGAVATTVTVTAGGSNYTFAPQVIIDAPAFGGIQATGYCTLSAGAVSTVTIVDQGAGYVAPPNITFKNDYREVNASTASGISAGFGAVAVLSLTGAQTVTGVLMTSPGTAAVSTIPTLTFSGGGGASAAATVIMNWTITAFAAGTAGVGLAGTFARITAEDAFPTTSPAYTNVTTQKNLLFTRSADIRAAISAGGITTTGSTILDGGCYSSSPTPLVIPTASIVTTAPVVTFTMGGAPGVSTFMRVG